MLYGDESIQINILNGFKYVIRLQYKYVIRLQYKFSVAGQRTHFVANGHVPLVYLEDYTFGTVPI